MNGKEEEVMKQVGKEGWTELTRWFSTFSHSLQTDSNPKEALSICCSPSPAGRNTNGADTTQPINGSLLSPSGEGKRDPNSITHFINSCFPLDLNKVLCICHLLWSICFSWYWNESFIWTQFIALGKKAPKDHSNAGHSILILRDHRVGFTEWIITFKLSS